MANEDELLGARDVPGESTSLAGSTTDDIGLLDAVDLPIVVIGRDCKIVRINHGATTVLGLTVSAIGQFLQNTLTGAENLNRFCAQVIADGVPSRFETRIGDRYFLLRIAPYTGRDRQILGAVVTFANVTAFRASIAQAIYEREYTKAILNAGIDPLVVLDAKLQVQTANRPFYALFGISREEAQGMSIRKLGNSEWEKSQVWTSIEAALSGETELQTFEIERDFPTIGSRTVVLDARRLTTDGNALPLLTFHDITERKQAEQVTGHLAAIVASSDDAIISKSLDGIIKSWNKSAERLFGYSEQEAIGKHITFIIPPDRHTEEDNILARLRHGERVDHFETVRMRKDGTTFDVSLTISPIRDFSGRVIGASKVARDISHLKRIERAVRDSEERLRALVNASSDVVYRMSPDWTEMRQLYGRGFISNSENPNKNWLQEYIHPDDQPHVLGTIQKAIQGKSVFELEHRVRRVNGTLGWTLSRAVPLFDEKGEIVEWFGAASDVTQRKEAEESYRKLTETLEEEVQARTKELVERNADVLAQAEQVRALSQRLLQTQDDERRHIARELHDSAGQTLTVLSMNLAKLVQTAGRTSPELTAQVESAQELVQQLHRELRTTSYLLHPPLLDEGGLPLALRLYIDGLRERSELDITFNISGQLGRLPRDMELVVFRLIQECLTNVHRHSGSKNATIQISREPDRIVVEIQDQGNGMSPQKLAEVQTRGSGLGIRGMRERLRQFHGELHIDSTSAGTTVLVAIPISVGNQELTSDAKALESAI